jgi:hypothetical protein
MVTIPFFVDRIGGMNEARFQILFFEQQYFLTTRHKIKDIVSLYLKMTVVNPYAKKSKNLDSSSYFKISPDSPARLEAIDSALRNSNPRTSADVPQAFQQGTPPKYPHANTIHDKSQRISASIVTPNTSITKKKKSTFQAQLRQQILDLKKKKRLKALEDERKVLEETRRAAAEAERIRKEDERKKKEEDRKRKEEEHERRREEEEKARRLRAQEKMEKQRLKATQKAEEQRIALENSQRLSLIARNDAIQIFHHMHPNCAIPIMTNSPVPFYPSLGTHLNSQHSFPFVYSSGNYSTANCGAFNPSFSFFPSAHMGLGALPPELTDSQFQRGTHDTPFQQGFACLSPDPTPNHHIFQEVKSYQSPHLYAKATKLTKKLPPPKYLSTNPMQHPSPFSNDYELMPHPLVIFKENITSPFGVSVHMKTQSILLSLESMDSTMTENEVITPEGVEGKKEDNISDNNIQSKEALSPKSNHDDSESSLTKGPENGEQSHTMQVKRRRRKRAFFHVMTVMDCSKQNEKGWETDPTKLLSPGDLILEIQGVKIGGLDFPQACKLFSSNQNMESSLESHSDKGSLQGTQSGLIRCSLLIARPKPKPLIEKPSKLIPKNKVECGELVKASKIERRKIRSLLDLNTHEMSSLVVVLLRVLIHNDRLLGYKATSEVWEECLKSSKAFETFDNSNLLKKLKEWQLLNDDKASVLFTSYWKKEWEQLGKDSKLKHGSKCEYMTLSQTSFARALPRPPHGCRCGEVDHHYVHDPSCILYYQLRSICETSMANVKPVSKEEVALKSTLMDLSAMELAYRDRILSLKGEAENEATEAKFVNEMEIVQVRQLKTAIFAPSLSVMVLSAVSMIGLACEEFLSSADLMDVTVTDSQEAFDEDDIPLLCLGKHSKVGTYHQFPSKKRKENTDNLSFGFHPAFLAKILNFIGSTWGHVYQDQSHEEFSWRWEVHHGQTSEDSRKREVLKSPRTPGKLTWEQVEFFVDDAMIDRFQTVSLTELSSLDLQNRDSQETLLLAQDLLRLFHLISPQRTGLLDELRALEQMHIIVKSKHGASLLAEDWFTHVDPLILNDMNNKWSYCLDPDNKYLIDPKVRRELSNYWIRVDNGWALNEDLSDVIFLDDEWEEWQRSFEADKIVVSNREDGIGRFGL